MKLFFKSRAKNKETSDPFAQGEAGLRDLFQQNVRVILERERTIAKKKSLKKKYPDRILPAHLFQQ